MRRIVWEKWRDSENYEETVQNLNEESDDLVMDDESQVSINIHPYKVRTPIGEYSVLDNNLPSRMFDCWIGHANFAITEEEFNILDLEIDGIEVLRIVSKYRFFIGVAKLFKFRDVADQINKALCDKPVEIDESLIKDLMAQDPTIKRWAALMYENGDVEYISSSQEEDEEFDELCKEMSSNPKAKFIQGHNE